MRVLGIDPGRDGALVVLDETGCLYQRLTAEICPLDYLPEAMAGAVRDAQVLGVTRAVLELPFVQPGRSISQGLLIGTGWGLWRGILAALHIETLEVRPRTWQGAILKGSALEGKARAIARATSIPRLHLSPGKKRVPHSGLADAACLALYGLEVSCPAP